MSPAPGPSTAVVLLGWTLAGASSLTSLPQTVRLARTQAVQGLSATTELAWTISWALWVSYSITVQAWPKAAAESVGLVGEAVLTVVLLRALARQHRARPAFHAAVPFAAAWVAATMLARQIGGPEALAAALAAFDGASLAPALRATLRAPTLEGLSLPTWVVKVVVAFGWIGYAVGIDHPLAAGWTVVMAPAGVLIVVRIVRDRRRRTRNSDRVPVLSTFGPDAAVIHKLVRAGTPSSPGPPQ